MRKSTILLLVAASFAFVGCHIRARATVHAGPGPEPQAGHTSSDGQAVTPGQSDAPPPAPSGPNGGCHSSAECGEGMTCTGEPGCGQPWTCQPARPCTRDLVPFCGCDGQTFRSSSSCPGRPVRHRGPCESDIDSSAANPVGPPVSRVEGQRPTPPEGSVAQGGVCASSDQCADGLMCLGTEGCNTPATCQPRRPCTADLRPFCGCDGQTFRGSSSCPPRSYAHTGGCVSDGPVPTPDAQ